MQTRFIIAYVLIGLLMAAALLLARHVVLRRREHQRLMRGRGDHNRQTRRRSPAG